MRSRSSRSRESCRASTTSAPGGTFPNGFDWGWQETKPVGFHRTYLGVDVVGELRKPRWWVLALLERLGSTRLPVRLDGDGAGSLVETLAVRAEDGRGGVLVWNMTLDQTKASGEPTLARDVEVEVSGLPAGGSYRLTHHRVDADHSNIASLWGRIRRDGQEWPDEDQWATLRAADRLDELEPPREVAADADGAVHLSFALPMPGASYVELVPV